MSSALHPIFAAVLAPFAPPSSSIFDSVREPEEAALQPMRKFIVTVVRRLDGRVLRQFEAMGPDSFTVAERHVDLAGAGERLHVMTPEAFEMQRANDREAYDATHAQNHMLRCQGKL